MFRGLHMNTALLVLTTARDEARFDGEELLDRIESSFACVSMDLHARRASAIWTLLTHVYEEFTWSPRLLVYAPAPQSGKSTLLERIAALAARPNLCHDLTPAVFFRDVDEFR